MPIFPVIKLATPPSLSVVLPFDADQKKIYDFVAGDSKQIFQIRSEFDGKKIELLTEDDVKIFAPTNGNIKNIEATIFKNEINKGTNNSGIDLNLVVEGTAFLMVNFPNKDGTGNGLGKFSTTTVVPFNEGDTLWFEIDIDDGLDTGGKKIEASSINYMYTVLP